MTLTLREAQTAAFRASNLLRTTARALDGDTPELPGDSAAAAQAVEIAIEQLWPVIDALDMAGRRHEPLAAENGPAALYDQWKALRVEIVAIVDANGGDDPETPEFEALNDKTESHAQLIAKATPTTDLDAAAMLEWCMADSEGVSACDLYTQAQTAVVKYLMGQS